MKEEEKEGKERGRAKERVNKRRREGELEKEC